jgi:hypothetical protein
MTPARMTAQKNRRPQLLHNLPIAHPFLKLVEADSSKGAQQEGLFCFDLPVYSYFKPPEGLFAVCPECPLFPSVKSPKGKVGLPSQLALGDDGLTMEKCDYHVHQ